jgi:hypothetical protein
MSGKLETATRKDVAHSYEGIVAFSQCGKLRCCVQATDLITAIQNLQFVPPSHRDGQNLFEVFDPNSISLLTGDKNWKELCNLASSGSVWSEAFRRGHREAQISWKYVRNYTETMETVTHFLVLVQGQQHLRRVPLGCAQHEKGGAVPDHTVRRKKGPTHADAFLR